MKTLHTHCVPADVRQALRGGLRWGLGSGWEQKKQARGQALSQAATSAAQPSDDTPEELLAPQKGHGFRNSYMATSFALIILQMST